MRTGAYLIILALALFDPLYADEPPLTPAPITIYSPSGSYYARIDPKSGIEVFSSASEGTDYIWKAPGWSWIAALSDTGEHLVLGYEGINLVPYDYDLNMVMLTFFHNGQVIKTVTLGELVDDALLDKHRTLGHRNWGMFNGLVEDGHYEVKTSENQIIHFNMATGERVFHE